MYYFLNGGRNERGILKSDAACDLYARLGVSRLVVITYAIVEESWQRMWHEKQDAFGIPNLEVRALTTLDTNMDHVRQQLQWANFIYLPGGAQKTLLRRMNELGVGDLLRIALDSPELKLFGGGSAGAMVMGNKCIIGRNRVVEVVDGLNYMPKLIIDSHFSNRGRESRLKPLVEKYPLLTGMGLDEDTAVVLNKNFEPVTVMGYGTVNVYTKNKKETYDSYSQF